MQNKNTKKIYKHLFTNDFQDILYLKIILKNYRFRFTCYFLNKKIHVII